MDSTKLYQSDENPPPPTGEVSYLGKYQIIKQLGEGGFGTVFKCYDPVLQVYRALKEPLKQNTEANKILGEARKQAKLRHPNIVQVHSVDEIDGKWVIVMDYEGGIPLNKRLARGKPITINEAVNIAIQIAKALRESHKANIAHHDIKPENILFSEDGIPKLADFGISREVRSTQKEMSTVIGSVKYMAPEHIAGKIDIRSDIWSLGVVLYEMLSGYRPFEGQNYTEIMYKICNEDPSPIYDINLSIPGELGDIVMRMMQKDPDKRYQSMDVVINALESLQSKKDVENRTLMFSKVASLLIP
ncbi:serine/threonine protein kinase, partial [bacterium]|nr:serine/threonine protein kinase [bacterium]